MTGELDNFAADTPPSRGRRWRQFSLRTFLLLTAVVAAAVGWVSTRHDWIRQRRAALAELEPSPGTLVTEERKIHDPTSVVSPPWSLRLFGETRGIAKIRLEPIAIGLATAIAEQKRLAPLFPEAQVWIAPRNPGDPDPLDDNPRLAANWAAELKFAAMCFADELRHDELDNIALPIKRAGAQQECRRLLAEARETAVRTGGESTAIANLRQRLQVRQRLFAAESELAPTRTARHEIYRRHLATLAQWQKASPDNAAAIGAAALEATAAIYRREQVATPLSAHMESLAGQFLRSLQDFQSINALYMVGAKGGEAEKHHAAAFAYCQARAALAAARGDGEQQLADLRLAAHFADRTVIACDVAFKAIPEGKAFAGLCYILPQRAKNALAVLALEKELGILSGSAAAANTLDLAPIGEGFMDAPSAAQLAVEQAEFERRQFDRILLLRKHPSTNELLALAKKAATELPQAAILNVQVETWTIERAVRSCQRAADVRATLARLAGRNDDIAVDQELLENLESLGKLVQDPGAGRMRPAALARCEQLFVAQEAAACRVRIAEADGDNAAALKIATDARSSSGDLCRAADEAYHDERMDLADWVAAYAYRRQAHLTAARLAHDSRQQAAAWREFATAMQKELERLRLGSPKRGSDEPRLRFELAVAQAALARLGNDRDLATRTAAEAAALGKDLTATVHTEHEAELATLGEDLATLSAASAAARESARLAGDSSQELGASVFQAIELLELGQHTESMEHFSCCGAFGPEKVWEIACEYFLARSRLLPAKLSAEPAETE